MFKTDLLPLHPSLKNFGKSKKKDAKETGCKHRNYKNTLGFTAFKMDT